jgi:anaphase-promoting complex subunit 1
MGRGSRYFNLRLEDLRYVADFYGKVYDRRFSGRTENNPRPPLIRENTVLGALHSLNEQLDLVRAGSEFQRILKLYVRGQPGALLGGGSDVSGEVAKDLAWYLQQNGVPPSGVLIFLRDLARKAHEQCLGAPGPEGTTDAETLDEGIREVLHVTAASVAGSLGQGWTARSLNEVLRLWN